MSENLGIAVRRFDIGAYLRSHHYDIYETSTGEVNLDCPFCGAKQKFYINALTKLNLCWKCGWRSDLLDFIMELNGIQRHEAITIVMQNQTRFRRLNEVLAERQKTLPTIEYPPSFELLSFPVTERNRRYWQYLEKREVLPSVALEYGLGFCAAGPYQRRIVVPVFWDKRLVSWVARSLSNKVQKTKLTPPGNKQSHYLLNLDRLWGMEELVLVEGPFDMLKIPKLSVASFGKKVSRTQVNLLTQSGANRIVIAYDDDAVKETWKTAKILSERFEVRVVDMPPGRDPGNLPEAEVKYLIKHAQPYSAGAYLEKMYVRGS